MSENIEYFDEGGRHNTEATLKLAKEKALEKGIKNVAIASIRGYTAKKAIEIFRDTDIEITIIGCNACNECPPFSEEIKKQVESAGYQVIFVPEGSIPYPESAQLAYRRICEGMKVCVFIAMGMAEKEIVPSGEEIIAVAGTGWKGYEKGGGSDTAIVIEARTSEEFWTYQPLLQHKLEGRKVKEIICKPR